MNYGRSDHAHHKHWQIKYRRRLLRVTWAARRSRQSILKEINPEYSGMNIEYSELNIAPTEARADSLEKTLMLGKIGGRRRRGWQRMR